MSTAAADGFTTLFERDVINPDGLRLEGGRPTAGSEWSVWVDLMDDGSRVLHVDQQPTSLDVAREIRDALSEAITIMEGGTA